MQKKILSYVLAVCVGAAICMYFDKEVHEVQERIVYKDRIKTVVKEVITENPDGSRTIERETTKDEKKDQVSNKKETRPVKKDWLVSVKADLFSPAPAYTAEVSRRVIGDFYIGTFARTDGVVGVGVTLAF